jgi:hypothetical protein
MRTEDGADTWTNRLLKLWRENQATQENDKPDSKPSVIAQYMGNRGKVEQWK